MKFQGNYMNYPKKDLQIIILAAGKSSRYQSPKQLAPWGLLELIPKLKLLQLPINIILGAHFEKIKKCIPLELNVSIIENRRFELGLSSSLKIAYEHFPNSDLFFVVVDMPHIPIDHYVKLKEKFFMDPEKCYATSFNDLDNNLGIVDNLGVPAIIPSRFTKEILSLGGDRGAKQILKNHDYQACGKRELELVFYQDYERENYNYPFNGERPTT